jgi:hypothetical protein
MHLGHHPMPPAEKHLTLTDISDRTLVIAMLTNETAFASSNKGTKLFLSNPDRTKNFKSEHTIRCTVLRAFGFAPSAESLAVYDRIFLHYYKSATDYDHGVINAAYYMKNNRCKFYLSLRLDKGDTMINVPLKNTVDQDTDLFSEIDDQSTPLVMVCAFSTS